MENCLSLSTGVSIDVSMFTFYLEFDSAESKRLGKNSGNCVAIEEHGDIISRGWFAMDEAVNSDNCDYIPVFTSDLTDRMEEITADEAFIHHPNLFNYL